MNHTVFFITNNYKPYSGGVVSSIDATIAALEKFGIKIFIITLDYGTHEQDKSNVFRIYCPITFNYKKNPMGIPVRAYTILKKLTQRYKPALFHVHHPFLLGTTAQKLAQQLHIPVIFTYHTQYDKYLHYIPMPQILTEPITSWLVNKFCKQVATIIAPSQTIATRINKKNCALVPSPLGQQFCNPSIKHTPQSPLKLLCVSRFTKEKNLFFLLGMLKLLENSPIISTFIGYGPLEQALVEYAFVHLKLSPQNHKFIIAPPKPVLLKAYQEADLFIFASTTETQGLVLAESMSQGTPVIALPGPGINDIVIDGVNGYLVSSQQQMAQKISYLLESPDCLIKLQENAFTTAKQYFPDTIAQKLLEQYNFLLK